MLGTNMHAGILFAVSLALGGCAAPGQRPEPAALEAKATLPPHVVEVMPGWGWYSCAPDYILRRGACVAESEIPPGPEIIVSSAPSAGDGAAGGRLCPSGGCGSYATPSYSTFVYSGGSSYDYWPTGFYYGGGGVLCPPRVRRFRGSELAFGGRFGSFVQERRFEGWKRSFPGAPFRVQSFAERRSQGGRFGGGNRTGHRR
jgi:hypothetical protein